MLPSHGVWVTEATTAVARSGARRGVCSCICFLKNHLAFTVETGPFAHYRAVKI